MTLDQILQTVQGSAVADWYKTEAHTVYGWEWGTKGGQNYLEPVTHSKLLIYRPDIDVSLVMDATVTAQFQEPWATAFPDPNAESVAVQLRFRGSVVYDWLFVIVDGGRYLLPLPRPVAGGGYELPQADLPLARLFFGLYGVTGVHKTVEAALAHAHVAIV
jgi:hypothetical protein